jgi:hypothetical protein
MSRRDPVSGVVLVITVVLLGAGRTLNCLGAALSQSQSLGGPRGLPDGHFSELLNVLWSIED